MNRLIHESSDYLKSHATNPVDWYPWGEEALEKAKTEDKPILLSIGYSSCHWCHVMNRESFTNEAIANFMNTHFINIKVDREERPDLDETYQSIIKKLSNSNGWPLNVFLTPSLKPFFGGTYFGPSHTLNKYDWVQAIQFVHYNYTENKSAVTRKGDQIINRLKVTTQKEWNSDNIAQNKNTTGDSFEKLMALYDKTNGGWGNNSKFPNTSALTCLLTNSAQNKKTEKALFHTLNQMVRGGLYDQIGSGIFRYTVDKEWKVPHFEKMLYDNALFIKLLAEICKYKDKTKYKRLLKDTIHFMSREMMSPEGAFYSAMDAESQGSEGSYYTWNKDQIDLVLENEAGLFCEFHNITEEGNWEQTNIITQPYDLWEYADKKGIDRIELRDQFIKNRKQLLELRNNLPSPFVDKKIILGWNALMTSALAHSYMTSQNPTYLEMSTKLITYLLDKFYDSDTHKLNRILYSDKISGQATLRDYAYFLRALLDIYYITHDSKYLDIIKNITHFVLEAFAQKNSSLLRYSLHTDNYLLDQIDDIYDEEMPSGNAVIMHVLSDLGIIFDIELFSIKSREINETLSSKTIDSPLHHTEALAYNLTQEMGVLEISIIGIRYKEYSKSINQHFLASKIIAASEEKNDKFHILDKEKIDGKTLIYVCQNKTCHLPVETVAEFIEEYI